MKPKNNPELLTTDVLVVGGGIVGVSAAIAIAESGADTIVVDAGDHAGTNANAGSLHVQMQSRFLSLFPELVPGVEASLPLYVQAANHWESLHHKHGGVGLNRNGGLMVAETARDLRFLEEKAERESKKGLRVDLVDQAGLQEIAPYFGEQVIGGEICFDEGKVNPLIANQKFRSHAKDLSVRFVNDRVLRVEAKRDRIEAIGRGTYRADQIVLATAWSTGDLVTDFGLSMNIQAEPLHMNITEPAGVQLAHLVQHANRPLTLKQLETGQIVIGGGWPAQASEGRSAPMVKQHSLIGNLAIARHLVPAVSPLRIVRTWAGYNTTADGISLLGYSQRVPRVIFAVPGDAGYTLGPLLGAAAGNIALGKQPPFDPKPFSPDRFTES